MVEVAETSGTVPEQLQRLSPQFEETARRAMRALTMALTGVIWFVTAGFIVYFIFSVILWYAAMISGAAAEAMG